MKNKQFSNFDGKEIKNFIDGTETITKWLEEKFVKSKHNDSLINGLYIWVKISHFLRRSKIYEVEDSKNEKHKKLLNTRMI